MAAAEPTVAIDNEQLRVTTWSFTDGADTGHHIHEYDYLVVPITGGTFAAVGTDGTSSERVQEAGVPYEGKAGAEHNVFNRSGRAAAFTEIEFKQR
jgi:beta-alanine degradation protein BauB